MKISHLSEETYENITIIQDIIRFIIDRMPNVIPQNSIYEFGFTDGGKNIDWTYNSTSPEIKSLKELIEENRDNEKIKNALIRLSTNKIVFHNTEEKVYHSNLGDYSFGPINIYVSTIQKSSKPFVIKKSSNNPYPNFYFTKFIQVLAHELRHLFQDVEYPDYLRTKSHRNIKTGEIRDWNDRQVEWDAKWTDILTKTDPEDYSTASGYAEEVMSEFLQWVKLSDKIKKHYYKKTINYHINWYKKKIEKTWEKLKKIMKPLIIDGTYNKQQFIEYVLDDLVWYGNTETLPTPVVNHYKSKANKFYDSLMSDVKIKKRIETHIEQYHREWENYLEQFLDANNNRLKEINTYAASSYIANRLSDNNPEFFYSKNTQTVEIAKQVINHFYNRSIDIIEYAKER
jgi:hypothetical protein